MSKTKKTEDNELVLARQELVYLTEEKQKLSLELTLARKELAFQKEEKGKRAAELGIATKELVFQDGEKEKRAAELGIANIELAFQDEEKGKRAAELGIANKELAFQDKEKEKRAAELGIANIELAYQDGEKEKRAAELVVANKELAFQDGEKEKRAAELIVANKELVYQNEEKEKRAAELSIANKELVFQNNEKEKRAAELIIANKELVFQNEEKEKRAAELFIANEELAFQNNEKEKRAAELIKLNEELKGKEQQLSNQINAVTKSNATIEFDLNGTILAASESFLQLMGYTEKEIVGKHHSIFVDKAYAASTEYKLFWGKLKKGLYQKDEFKRLDKKGEFVWLLGSYNPILDAAGRPSKVLKIATDVTLVRKQVLELAQQSEEREKRAAELAIANKELAFQNDEKEKRAAELIIANEELAFQNNEKEKRAAELVIANEELVFQNAEKEKRAAELIVANKELLFQNKEKEKRAAELDIANKELAFQNTEKEKRAEEKERRAAELIIANEELLFQNGEKEKRAAELEEKNREVEAARSDIEKKTKQLEVSSKYKSEFLANMSHELRTPLNSLLILSKDLSENKKKNLTEDQVECAEIIYKSGHDLLVLINEVLDLSKIEAGKMTINVETVFLKTFTEDLIRGFKHNAEQKGLKLNTYMDLELPDHIYSDSQRLKQILKNLISNAIKFTDKGGVNISLNRHSKDSIIIAVADTGIGIQESHQMAVFEAFQQADGTTSRKYGGTGLGLSISRELAKLLGSEITLSSIFNEGSTFSLIVPIGAPVELSNHVENAPLRLYRKREASTMGTDPQFINYPTIKDDRDSIGPEDKVVLIIEDDLKFSEILLKLANEKGFKCLSATTGEDGFLLAGKYLPEAIILDMGLPGINGHALLLKLKSDPGLRHIPVHIISGNEENIQYLNEGAVEFLMKPVHKVEMEGAFDRIEKLISRKIKNLLIIEDDPNSRKALKVLIGNENVNYLEAGDGENALTLFKKNEVDCIILDIDLPDMTGFDFIHKLENMKGKEIPRIIVYTGVDLTPEEKAKLQKYTNNIIQKGTEAETSLLKSTTLFLTRTANSLQVLRPQEDGPRQYDANSFAGKKILLVDDDYRNVFALSRLLTEQGMEIIKAENGIVALEKLEANPGIELVLMDIMMPEMDGYEAMRRIRVQEKHNKLPVIAVTAKAMAYDLQKCIAAGANDYITKPVEIKDLLHMMGALLEAVKN